MPACVQSECAGLVFGEGVIPDDAGGNSCEDGVSLLTGATCDVKCAAGYRGGNSTVTCASDALHGANVTGMVLCLWDVCPEYNFSSPVLPDETAANGGCEDGVVMTSGEACDVTCAESYVSADYAVQCEATDFGVELTGAPSGCTPCHSMDDEFSVVTGLCTECSGPLSADCLAAECTPGFREVSDEGMVTTSAPSTEANGTGAVRTECCVHHACCCSCIGASPGVIPTPRCTTS